MQPEQQGVKTWQWVVTVIVIIILIILGFTLFKGNGAPAPYTGNGTSTDNTQTNTTNGVAVSDQFPGNIVYISSVQLAAPGFVVIAANNNGTPGAVLGSKYFAAGINPGQVNLTKSMVDGSCYYAILYSDTNGNGVYDAGTDMPVTDATGATIMKLFHATSNVQQVKG